MTDKSVYEWYSVLPQTILDRAYSSLDGELAWSRSDAMQVLNQLQAKGYRILGVDIWLATQPGPTIPTPFVYDWSERYPISAIDFVETFEWDKSDQSHLGQAPYFNITA